MKYAKYIIAVLALFLALSAFSFAPESHTEADFLLDTYVSITVYGRHGDKAAKAALARVRELDRLLSAFYPESDVAKINRAGANTPTAVSEECFHLLLRALSLCKQSDGAFDVTIKPVMDLWGFGSDNQRIPAQNELSAALDKVDFRFVSLNSADKTVTLLKEGMAIDLGGVAKGYCADEAAEVLKNEGAENFYLDFGGNVITKGEIPLGLSERLKRRAKTRPFVVGIQDPKGTRGNIFETITTEQAQTAIVTSGGYERYFEENGVNYHHILSPATGKQPQNGVLSVTVVGSQSETADALSTALFVLGPGGCEKFEGLFDEVLFVMDTGEVKKIYPRGEK